MEEGREGKRENEISLRGSRERLFHEENVCKE